VSAELLSSKVVVLEEEPQVRGIPALSTSIAGAVGISEKGPIGQATLVTSWEEYVRRFGGFTAGADLPLAVLGFFQNGGRQLYVVRTCHYEHVDDATSALATVARATIGSGGATSTPVLRVEAESPGAWGNRLSVELVLAAGGPSFDLVVRQAGTVREIHRNLVLDAASTRYVVRVLNDPTRGSARVRVVDLGAPPATIISAQTRVLEGGDDGLTGLDEGDFLGSSVGRTGLHALDSVRDLALLFVPGRATPTTHNEIVRYCADDRRGTVFAVLDPPADATAAEILQYQTQIAGLEELSEHAAIYWPRITIPNPDRRVFGSAAGVAVPPSGAIAGVIARTDASRPGGVYEPPAGVEVGRLRGVMGLESDEALDERKRDLLYPRRINPLNRADGGGWYVDGVYTLKGTGNFPTLAERRGVSFIERSLRAGLDVARHRPNDEALRAQLRRTITSFLTTQMNLGAFASRVPATAFFIEVSDDEEERLRGEVHVRIGLAMSKPAEFIVLHLSAAVAPAA